MRINFCNGEMNGWFNVSTLDDLLLVPTNFSEEIVAPNCVHLVKQADLEKLVKCLFDKLSYGGKLIIGGYDSIELCKIVIRDQIEPAYKHTLIENSQSFLSLDETVNLLKAAGFIVVSKKLDGLQYTVTCLKSQIVAGAA